MTREELAKRLSEVLDENYKWVAKNASGNVVAYGKKPTRVMCAYNKKRSVWESEGIEHELWAFNKNLFECLSWDDEPLELIRGNNEQNYHTRHTRAERQAQKH